MRFVWNVAPWSIAMAALCLFAFGAPVFGQSLFEDQPEDAPLTAAEKAAGEKESIFCPTMKTGQVCTHGTAAILGLTGKEPPSQCSRGHVVEEGEKHFFVAGEDRFLLIEPDASETPWPDPDSEVSVIASLDDSVNPMRIKIVQTAPPGQ